MNTFVINFIIQSTIIIINNTFNMENTLLIKFDNVFQGNIVKRPSKSCKTPYVADVLLQDNSEILGHSPSLGCCGLADKDATVL